MPSWPIERELYVHVSGDIKFLPQIFHIRFALHGMDVLMNRTSCSFVCGLTSFCFVFFNFLDL